MSQYRWQLSIHSLGPLVQLAVVTINVALLLVVTMIIDADGIRVKVFLFGALTGVVRIGKSFYQEAPGTECWLWFWPTSYIYSI